MRNPGKGRLLTFEPSSGNWRKNLGTDIRNGSVKKYPIIGIPFGLRPHSIPIMGNDTVNGILPIYHISLDSKFLKFTPKLHIIQFETIVRLKKEYNIFGLHMFFKHISLMILKKSISGNF